jgi:hypothetical protein
MNETLPLTEQQANLANAVLQLVDARAEIKRLDDPDLAIRVAAQHMRDGVALDGLRENQLWARQKFDAAARNLEAAVMQVVA